MLLCAVSTWAGDFVVSTTEGTPENIYTINNGNGIFVAGNGANGKMGKFAFYAVEGKENAYYIYSVSESKWFTYDQADSYGAKKDFVRLSDNKANYFHIAHCTSNSTCYEIRPYKSNGEAANIFLNWYGGTDGSPLGLWTQNGDQDSGSRMVIWDINNYPTANKFYVIEAPLFQANQGISKGLYVNSENNPAWNTIDLTDKAYYWTIEINDGGKFALKNVGTEKYLNGTTTSEEVVYGDIVPLTEMQFNIIVNNVTVHANNHSNGAGSGSNIVSWGGSVGSASAWQFVEKQDPDAVSELEITYNFTYKGETLEEYTQTVSTLVGEEYPNITVQFPYGISAKKPEGTIAAEDATDGVVTKIIELKVEKELPFETADDVNSITKWYYIQMHTNQPGYIGDIAEDNTINVAWRKASDVASENFIWGFVGNVFDGITVVNKGTSKQLTSSGNGNVTLTDAGTAFFIAQTTETNANATNGFCLRKSDSNKYLNANYGAAKMSHWDSTDAGSTFFLTEYEDADITVTDAGWATMYLGYAAYVPEGVKVYAVTGVNEYGYVNKQEITGTIPANTGVLLENAGDYTFKKAANYTAVIEQNIMAGSVEDSYIEGAAYILANGENGVGLYKAALNCDETGADGTTHFLNNAGKAYMRLPEQQNSATFYGFEWTGTTAIEGIEATAGEKAIYDLTGRKIDAITVPGLYIINGVKTIVE